MEKSKKPKKPGGAIPMQPAGPHTPAMPMSPPKKKPKY